MTDEITKKIEALEADLAQAHEELVAAKDKQVRALADLANFQRRQAEDQIRWGSRAIAGFLTKIVPNLLELSLGAAHSVDETAKTTIEKFFNDMTKHGFTRIDPAPGSPINPDEHEVLLAEEGEPGTVVKTLELGWKFQDQVIVPAKVSAAPLN